MSRISNIAFAILRFAYGGFFAAISAFSIFSLVQGRGNPFLPELSGIAAQFQVAMEATGFLVPIMLACFLVGGIALFFHRTAPLGIALLAPFVIVIFFYHLMLTGNWPWGTIWAAGLAILAWRYRRAFVPLWNYRD